MIHTLQNEKVVVQVNSIGAELHSIISKKDQKEFLWQGDPSIWASQAPVLFPIIGGLKDGTYLYQGNTYKLPKHGFIRYHKNLQATQNTDHKVTFSLSSSDETLKKYPFHFIFDISYELRDAQIIVSHTIKNTDGKTMFFSIGGHPAFNCPIHPKEKYEDYYIHLEKVETTQSHVLNTEGLITKQTITTAIDKDRTIRLNSTIFDNDALIFKQINAQKATLTHVTKGPVISMDFTDFPDLGIWAKPQAPYVCIEPWLGYADIAETNQQLEEKEGIQQLERGATHLSSYTISIMC